MLTRFRSNVSRWPRVFAALVILTQLTLVVNYGLCRYIGHLTVKDSLLLVGAFVVLCAAADGILYSIFAPTHAFSVASLLDRVEGRHVSAIEPSCDECDNYEEDFDSEEETEEETEDEEDDEPSA
jgi:hypothetical protein